VTKTTLYEYHLTDLPGCQDAKWASQDWISQIHDVWLVSLSLKRYALGQDDKTAEARASVRASVRFLVGRYLTRLA
jgi:hypothetical protein